jgi:hypothetical protein
MKTLKMEKIREISYITLGLAGILLSTYALISGNRFLGKLIMVFIRIFFHQHVSFD